MIKARSNMRHVVDEIDEVLGSAIYMQNYYPKDLRDRLLGPHSTQLVGVSRFYLRTTPKTIVDFEPSPLDGKFFVEEKRQFFMAQGIAYIPVFLIDRLTKEAFAERAKTEIAAATAGHQDVLEDRVFEAIDIEAMLTQPEVSAAINAKALARADARTNVKGAARLALLARFKREITAELRQKAKDGRLGRGVSGRELALAAG